MGGGSRGKCGRCKLVRGPMYDGHHAHLCPWRCDVLPAGNTKAHKANTLSRIWDIVIGDVRGAVTPEERRRLLEASGYELLLDHPKGGFVMHLLFHQRSDLSARAMRAHLMHGDCYS